MTPDDVQRQTIALASRRLFMGKGYGGTTMDDIAAACHISKRTLYQLFAAKPDLFAAVIEDHAREMLALPGDYDHLPLNEAIAGIFRLDISEGDDRERLAVLMLLMSEAQRFPELAHLPERHGVGKQRQLLADWLLRRAETRDIAITDGLMEARILMDMIFGAPPPPGLDGGIVPPPRMERDRRQRLAIEIFSRGVSRSAASTSAVPGSGPEHPKAP